MCVLQGRGGEGSNSAAWHIQSASSFLTCWPFCRWPFCCGPVVGSVYLGAFCFPPLPPLPPLCLFVQTEICKFVKHFLMCLILFHFFLQYLCVRVCVCVFVCAGTSFGTWTWTCVAGETLSLSLYITSGFIGQQGLTQPTTTATARQVTQLVCQWASIKHSPPPLLRLLLLSSSHCIVVRVARRGLFVGFVFGSWFGLAFG